MVRYFENRSWGDWLFDLSCVLSVVGLWPRFIEPQLLCQTRHRLALANLPRSFDGMRLLLFSDLHINKYSSPGFVRRLRAAIDRFAPHLILFAGDLLTYAKLENPQLADILFSGLEAPLGVFACLGNHDYASYRDLDWSDSETAGGLDSHPIIRGLQRLFGGRSEDDLGRSRRVPPLPMNEELGSLYKAYNIHLLNNETVPLSCGSSKINLTGLGDLSSGHFLPSVAFRGYDQQVPGIVFAHNPDCYSLLSPFPGDLFFFGHTHGGQINLPFLWKRITLLVDTSLKSGLYLRDGRMIFVTRGVGAVFPFRLFCPPQIALCTLSRGGAIRSEVRIPALADSLSARSPFLAASQTYTPNE